ncbi:TetR/AcrR family transcriptional regulator [Streptomyces sp. KLMMK]|uniref:TetR/AcrR family transcriptional regulator n=1 Tax=Streptomyces sp. KLMMK TaxID=3109353 RepID=UPI0030081879
MADRARLTRERVVGAALRIVDGEGLDGLSMRRVAEELGVETMALYRYTPSKDDLLDGLVERIFIELEESLSGTPFGAEAVAGGGDEDAPPWREALVAVARAMYRVALAHPNVAPLLALRPFAVPLTRRPPAVLRAHERLLTRLERAGLGERATLELYRAVISWVLGYILFELREVVDNPDEPEPAFRMGLHRLPVKEFPRLRALGPGLAVRGGEEQLAAGVTALVDRFAPPT